MINISAVGDIFLGDYTISLGFGIRSSIKKFGLDYHFGNVKNIFLTMILYFVIWRQSFQIKEGKRIISNPLYVEGKKNMLKC